MDERPAGLTSYAGVPLFIETARAVGLPAFVERFLGAPWGHRRGYSAADLTMILLAGIAAGARDVDDIAAMGQDKGLQELLELAKWPSASTIKRFLYWFHDLPQWTGGEKGRAVLPPESGPLLALALRQLITAGRLPPPPRGASILVLHDQGWIRWSRSASTARSPT
jgi:hypothetical protein